GAAAPSVFGLRIGNGHADRRAPVVLVGKRHEAAPPTADVEDTIARGEAELPAGQIELVVLGPGERRGVLPVSARIDHAWVHDRLEELRAEVVVDARTLSRPPGRLSVPDPGYGRREDVPP